jgi:hypothetical protein
VTGDADDESLASATFATSTALPRTETATNAVTNGRGDDRGKTAVETSLARVVRRGETRVREGGTVVVVRVAGDIACVVGSGRETMNVV